MTKTLYIYADTREEADAFIEQVLLDPNTTFIKIEKAIHFYNLLKNGAFKEYNRVILDLSADDLGLACAVIAKDLCFNFSWTAHPTGREYVKYMKLIKKEMKI